MSRIRHPSAKQTSQQPTTAPKRNAPRAALPPGQVSKVAPSAPADPQAVVQMFGGTRPETAPWIQSAAALGTSGTASKLPHLAEIQQAFGAHDVSNVQAHLDTSASTGAKLMGASAFTKGNHVAFTGTPSLRTAAHEAAHVVQQRQGLQLESGVGQAGDRWERQADEVADRVAQGRSAADLLGSATASSGPTTSSPPVQRQVSVMGKSLTYEDFERLLSFCGLQVQKDSEASVQQEFASSDSKHSFRSTTEAIKHFQQTLEPIEQLTLSNQSNSAHSPASSTASLNVEAILQDVDDIDQKEKELSLEETAEELREKLPEVETATRTADAAAIAGDVVKHGTHALTAGADTALNVANDAKGIHSGITGATDDSLTTEKRAEHAAGATASATSAVSNVAGVFHALPGVNLVAGSMSAGLNGYQAYRAYQNRKVLQDARSGLKSSDSTTAEMLSKVEKKQELEQSKATSNAAVGVLGLGVGVAVAVGVVATGGLLGLAIGAGLGVTGVANWYNNHRKDANYRQEMVDVFLGLRNMQEAGDTGKDQKKEDAKDIDRQRTERLKANGFTSVDNAYEAILMADAIGMYRIMTDPRYADSSERKAMTSMLTTLGVETEQKQPTIEVIYKALAG